jgi:hypothetical protein
LEEIVAASVKKTETNDGGIRCADDATLSIRKSWHYFANKRRSVGRHISLAHQSYGVFFIRHVLSSVVWPELLASLNMVQTKTFYFCGWNHSCIYHLSSPIIVPELVLSCGILVPFLIEFSHLNSYCDARVLESMNLLIYIAIFLLRYIKARYLKSLICSKT